MVIHALAGFELLELMFLLVKVLGEVLPVFLLVPNVFDVFEPRKVLTHVRRVVAGGRPAPNRLGDGTHVGGTVTTAESDVVDADVYHLAGHVGDLGSRAQPRFEVTRERLTTFENTMHTWPIVVLKYNNIHTCVG